MNFTSGATLSGGSSVTLTPTGIQPGKSTYVGPNHTRQTVETVGFTVSVQPANAKTGKLGTGRIGLTLRFTELPESEDPCCATTPQYVNVDMGITSSTGVSDTLVHRARDYLRGISFTTAFSDALDKLILPQT
jgi:hypothetical protein